MIKYQEYKEKLSVMGLLSIVVTFYLAGNYGAIWFMIGFFSTQLLWQKSLCIWYHALCNGEINVVRNVISNDKCTCKKCNISVDTEEIIMKKSEYFRSMIINIAVIVALVLLASIIHGKQ